MASSRTTQKGVTESVEDCTQMHADHPLEQKNATELDVDTTTSKAPRIQAILVLEETENGTTGRDRNGEGRRERKKQSGQEGS